MQQIKKPYLLFLGDVESEVFAKTAFGLRDWSRDECVGQWSLPECTVDVGLPRLSPTEAAAQGAQSLVIAIASIGGKIPDKWIPTLIDALEAGLDLVNGMHVRLCNIPEIAAAASKLRRTLHDVRHADQAFPIATGKKRSGRRVLTVGTDCSLGKKYSALAITRELERRGECADFRATGQTGIMIAGQGVAIDAVVADFIAGAAETLSPDNHPEHWDVIEGQGSLFHPAYAGVTLGLLHGSQPDALILCHDPTRRSINGFPDYPMPTLSNAIDHFLRAAKLTNPTAEFVGVCLNTSALDDAERREVMRAAADETGLPCCDPMKEGVASIVDRLMAVAKVIAD